MADANSYVVIRVFSGESGKGAIDWTVQLSDVTFGKLLDLINQVEDQNAITAFEYEDEDGDRITVRSEEEMDNMLSYYVDQMEMSRSTAKPVAPLEVYPRVGKSSRARNIDGLTVNTKEVCIPTDNCMVESPLSSMELSGGSTKQEPQDLGQILCCGDITHNDLHYISTLGSGSCGTVHRAIHKASGTVMAVKVIPLDISAETQKNIISELQVLYKCESRVIISFYGAFFQENKISICTEFMDGGSLDKFGRIPEPILGRMAVSVVEGLQYLWSLKIMHRDVKPSNILVNSQGQVKLCDFGVSVQLVNSIAKTYVGTNAYMAPERIRGEDYSIHSEVWSLGLSLFEMAMGVFPYKSFDQNPGKLLNTITSEAPPQLPTDNFSKEFVEFVSQCMQINPRARPDPNALKRHPFIATYNDGNAAAILSHWVLTKLDEMLEKESLRKAASC